MSTPTNNNSKNEKVFIIATILIVLLSLLPLLFVSRYDMPVTDDFAYSATTQNVWENSHSIVLLIKEGINTSAKFWNSWQGLYSAAFLQSLQPGIFGDKYYGITAYIMIFFIFAGMISLTVFMLRTYMKSTVLEALFIGFIMSFYAIQYLPDISEGIYWYNGAINYGFFWALQCFFIVLFLNHKRKQKSISSTFCLLLSIIIGIVIEGGNHVTAFSAILFIFGILIYDMYIKNWEGAIIDIAMSVILIVAFIINISSPGTTVRRSVVEGSNPVKAIISAICHGGWRVTEWTDLKIIYGILIILPVVLKIVVRFCGNNEFAFKKPGGGSSRCTVVCFRIVLSTLLCHELCRHRKT